MSEERKTDVVRSWLEWLREKELGQCVLTMRNNPEKFITIVKQKRKTNKKNDRFAGRRDGIYYCMVTKGRETG